MAKQAAVAIFMKFVKNHSADYSTGGFSGRMNGANSAR
jgi:hypothetical protein